MAQKKMLRKKSVRAWLPVNSTSRFHNNRREYLDKHVPLFYRDLPASLACLRPEISNTTIRIARPPRPIYDSLVRSNWLAQFGTFVEVQSDVTIDVDQLRRLNRGKRLDAKFLNYCSAEALGSALDIAFLLSELACPSCIDIDQGSLYVDRAMYFSTHKKTAHFSLVFPQDDDVQWPALSNIDLLTVTKWAKERKIMERELAQSSLERALAAYTHVIRLSPWSHGDGLFRAMQGLEAFYCEGTGDLRRQLSEKCRLWLGPWSDKKNIVGHLYDSRSKFLHGATGVTFATERGSSWDEDESTAQEMERAETFSTRLLIATLQRCIRDNTSQIEWPYAFQQS